MNTLLDMLLLFAASFLAATVFPAQSETVLVALHLGGAYSVALLLCVATTANVLGSCLNWWLGKYIARFQDKRWFPFTPQQLERAGSQFKRFGLWTLLFAWVPIIGDPLTLVAGMLRVRFLWFVALVTIGKVARYVAVLGLFS